MEWACCCESSERSGDAQAAYLGVLAPRLPPHIAEVSPKPHELFLKTIFVRAGLLTCSCVQGWARVGMPTLGIFLHHAAQSTLPDSWPLYAAT